MNRLKTNGGLYFFSELCTSYLHVEWKTTSNQVPTLYFHMFRWWIGISTSGLVKFEKILLVHRQSNLKFYVSESKLH